MADKIFEGQITVVLDISRDDDGHYWDYRVTSTGVPKDELYSLCEDGLLEFDGQVYSHIADIPE